MPFSEGDITYSEGHHDEFHQYLWARLLWDPHRSLEDVMTEYCTLYFGEEAVEPMVQALLQLEKDLKTPLAENEGIDRYYGLVQEAGKKIPPHLMEGNYRWRLHMQKAALDKYNQRHPAAFSKEAGSLFYFCLRAGLRHNPEMWHSRPRLWFSHGEARASCQFACAWIMIRSLAGRTGAVRGGTMP